MRVERYLAGWISSSAAIWRRGEDPEETIRFPVPAYLVETGSERILIDTGLDPAAVADGAQSHYGAQAGLFALEQEQAIDAQLDLSTLTRVVLTHLHFDHAGGLRLLPGDVPIVIQRREWEAGRDRAAVRRNFFFPRDYALDDRRLVLVDGRHDLLGDGSIELLPTPGHTPGHQSVRLGERLVLGVDVAHFAGTLDDLRFPVFGDDLAAQARSAERLRELRDGGVVVVPGHDPEILRAGPLEL